MTSQSLSRSATAAVAQIVSWLATASAARANFVLVSQNLAIDWGGRRADFTLAFNQRPDFKSIDVFGLPVNAFQIEFAGDLSRSALPYPQNLSAIVRGEEIHFANDMLPIRKPTGDGGPHSGGCGSVV